MNKRITSLMLVFTLILTMLATAVPALAAPIESTQLKVTADKTSAKPGDTITYTITMGPVSDMGSMQMCLDIPTGLTYVENSTELADGLKATLGFDDVAWTEISKMINGVASAADYESNTDTVIAEFQCTVDADFSGTAEVGLTNLEFGSCQTFEYHTDRFSVVKASVTVTVPHTHVYDQTSTDAAHLKTPATCTSPAVYYKSCTCGENGTETFEYGGLGAHNWTPATCTVPKTCSVCQATEGDPLGHTEGNEWKYDSDNHWHTCTVEGCGVVIESSKEAHTPDRAEATVNDPIKCSVCGYEIEAQLVPSTPVTNIAATVTAPALGQKPDYAPVIVANPADSVDLEEVYWYKIAAADFTGTDEDDWVEMASDETFTTGYYYSVDMYFNPNEGYKMSESATGTVNGMPHDDTYGELYEGDSAAYLCGLFEPLTVEYTIDLPFSLAVKLTGDEKPAKETFKFEIYDLGVEDAEFEIVKDSVTVENIAFDENGVAFIEGIIKIKVTGKEQLSNLTEGFSVRMVKGSTKGWTYASEQWRIEPFFENDALDLKIAVKEIVDGEISEEYANGMSFSVSYEAVTEPETPQTGDSSMMVLWIALFVVSGAGATAIYSRKRKSSAK